MERLMLEILANEVKHGNRPNNSFESSSFTRVVDAMKDKFGSLVSKKAKHALEKSMQQFCRLNLPSKECIIVGDLGCASGPNTLASVKEIIELIDSESRNMNYGLPYIQVFLNDLESNDFNSIFKSLPLFYDNLEKYGRQSGSCFIATMPGSFYGRLFPDHSIHFIHSSFSLHWLSQVPWGLVNEKGLPINKGNIHIGKTSPPEVRRAYLDKFANDFTNFLRMRSIELMPNGRLFLTMLSDNHHRHDAYNALDLLAMTLNDIHGYREQELRHIIEKEGSFKISHLETIKVLVGDAFGNHAWSLSRGFRAVYESMIVTYFGDSIVGDFFNRIHAFYTMEKSFLDDIKQPKD
ncbi:7-methylxanthosine synthase 1-like [Coffea eugenioides]|uniref:7-methylxanthosine synthase 1-like n=1 Tax=Coffea eugenioides TaxID=49369 RepID=UPI000F60B699|nr:7-methylxanthosine synthase 1-like [Coffea eugenioides]